MQDLPAQTLMEVLVMADVPTVAKKAQVILLETLKIILSVNFII